MDVHREQMLRGYLAMLVVEKPYRSLGTGKQHLWLASGSVQLHLQYPVPATLCKCTCT